jgi:hypothetical protein
MNKESNNSRSMFGPRVGPTNKADETPRREGGDDSLADASPTDSRADEKVIVNEQRENKTVNAPSQTAANTSEDVSNDEEIVNGG